MKRSIAWGIGITLAGSLAFAGACGNSVSDNSGGAGGAGAHAGTGGTPVTTTPTGGNGTGGTVIGTGGHGGGSGGGDVCTQACSHAEGCGQDVCDQIPIDCSTSQGMCLAKCVNDGNCAEINQAVNALLQNPPDIANSGKVGFCVVGCLQGGSGGGGAGGGTQTCLDCAMGDCAGVAVSCYGDTAPGGCRDWITCAGNCMFDTACTAGCDAMYPNAKPLYDPVYACACTSCPTACAAVDPCGMHGGAGGSGGAPN